MPLKHILSEFQSGRLTLTEFEAALEKWRADDFLERAAIAAMQGYCACNEFADDSFTQVSEMAFSQADSMLVERNKRLGSSK